MHREEVTPLRCVYSLAPYVHGYDNKHKELTLDTYAQA